MRTQRGFWIEHMFRMRKSRLPKIAKNQKNSIKKTTRATAKEMERQLVINIPGNTGLKKLPSFKKKRTRKRLRMGEKEQETIEQMRI